MGGGRLSAGQSGKVVSSEEGRAVGSECLSGAKTAEVLRPVDSCREKIGNKQPAMRSAQNSSGSSKGSPALWSTEGGAKGLSFHSRATGALS